MPLAPTHAQAQIFPAQSPWRSLARLLRSWFVDASATRLPAENDNDFGATDSGFQLINPDLIAKRDIYIIESGAGALTGHANSVATSALSVTQLGSVARAARAMSHKSPSGSLLVVNIDSADIEDVVDDLLAVKRMTPDLPVVICSAAFKAHDFSSQRRAIADASLQLPCDDVALALAIAAGVSNSQRNATFA